MTSDAAWRVGLRRLTRVLIGYGIVGLLVAALGIAALFVGLGRVNGLSDRLRDDVGGVARAMERTATVLDDEVPSVSFSAADVRVLENQGFVDITVVRSGDVKFVGSTLFYETHDITTEHGEDFRPIAQLIPFAPGETVKTIWC